MIDYREYLYQNDNIDKHGRVEIHTRHEQTGHNPFWLLALRFVVLSVMGTLLYTVGIHLLGQLQMPVWKSVALITGGLAIYIGASFFLRPNADMRNMGPLGGLVDDPTQYSDDINRSLLEWEATLAPGRFAAETLLDSLVYAGLIQSDYEPDPESE